MSYMIVLYIYNEEIEYTSYLTLQAIHFLLKIDKNLVRKEKKVSLYLTTIHSSKL